MPLQVIQPTPCISPSGGSQESFSDVPRHTEQLLPAASERFRKPPQQPRKTASSSTAAPIACIRTSCSSCSDDAASIATTVNSSVFAEECCCSTTSSSLPPSQLPLNDCNNAGASPAITAAKGGLINQMKSINFHSFVDLSTNYLTCLIDR